MALVDILVMLFSGFAATVVGLAAYFADKYIKSVDSRLASHSTRFTTLEKTYKPVDYNKISTIVDDKMKMYKSSNLHLNSKIDNIENDLGVIKTTLSGKVLPHIIKSNDYFGKIIIVEQDLAQHQAQAKTMFKALTVLAKKIKR